MNNSARAHSFLVLKNHKNQLKKLAMVLFFLEPNNQQILPTLSEKQNSPHQLPLLIEFYLLMNTVLQIRDWYRSRMKVPRDESPLLVYPILIGSCLTLNSPPQGSFILSDVWRVHPKDHTLSKSPKRVYQRITGPSDTPTPRGALTAQKEFLVPERPSWVQALLHTHSSRGSFFLFFSVSKTKRGLTLLFPRPFF
jgi:hypothetical protein